MTPFLFRKLLCLLALFPLMGCSLLVGGSDQSIPPQSGEWRGASADGSFTIQFTLDGDEDVFLLTGYTDPCTQRVLESPLRLPLNYSGYELDLEATAFSPRILISLTFTGSTRVEGTWETFELESNPTQDPCPAASGTWEGSPK